AMPPIPLTNATKAAAVARAAPPVAAKPRPNAAPKDAPKPTPAPHAGRRNAAAKEEHAQRTRQRPTRR
ncbi:MAG TPA: dihydrolipoamide succinyltransferase, partial [Sorangium sp.]|nr:dihydrolipoamide succinyltransferase [Sorangium sp.]